MIRTLAANEGFQECLDRTANVLGIKQASTTDDKGLYGAYKEVLHNKVLGRIRE